MLNRQGEAVRNHGNTGAFLVQSFFWASGWAAIHRSVTMTESFNSLLHLLNFIIQTFLVCSKDVVTIWWPAGSVLNFVNMNYLSVPKLIFFPAPAFFFSLIEQNDSLLCHTVNWLRRGLQHMTSKTPPPHPPKKQPDLTLHPDHILTRWRVKPCHLQSNDQVHFHLVSIFPHAWHGVNALEVFPKAV